jgi:uncharacterized damage-inducible protein DinB
MSDLDFVVRKSLSDALVGRRVHVGLLAALDGLPWALTGERAPRAPHTIHGIVQHMAFGQDFALALLRDEDPAVPEHAELGWPGGDVPASAEAWEELLVRLARGLDEATTFVQSADLSRPVRADQRGTRLEILQSAILHNSHHLGQVIQLRRMLGAWPPPGGGDTW